MTISITRLSVEKMRSCVAYSKGYMPANYTNKSHGKKIRKIRVYPFWFPCQNQPFLHLISCSDDFQSVKLDQIKSHAFLQHSTLSLTKQVSFLSLFYAVVVNNDEKWQNYTSETFRVFTLSDLTEKIEFFCTSLFPFPVLSGSHY